MYREMGNSGGNWADLPIEILDEILTKLSDIEDFIRFGGVCLSWRSASVETKKTNQKSFCPWMMLSEPEPPENFLDDETVMLINIFHQEDESQKDVSPNEDKDNVPRRFYNLSSKKTIELYLPEAQGRKCWGSNFGWLFTIGSDLNIHLLNPLTRQQISLPPQSTFQYQYEDYVDPQNLKNIYIERFVLSSHPNHNNCVVMVICSEEYTLAMTRPGERGWTSVKCPGGYEDIIFFNNLFYAIQHNGRLWVCDITTPVPEAIDFMPPPLSIIYNYKYYLVEMSGDLHVVVRMYKRDQNVPQDVYLHSTVKFMVYKLDFGNKKWIQLRDLSHHVLFLGNNSSFAISTSNNSQLCPDSIYFTDDYWELYDQGSRDMGLFNFGRKKIVNPFYSGDGILTTFSAPLFFIPNMS